MSPSAFPLGVRYTPPDARDLGVRGHSAAQAECLISGAQLRTQVLRSMSGPDSDPTMNRSTRKGTVSRSAAIEHREAKPAPRRPSHVRTSRRARVDGSGISSSLSRRPPRSHPTRVVRLPSSPAKLKSRRRKLKSTSSLTTAPVLLLKEAGALRGALPLRASSRYSSWW